MAPVVQSLGSLAELQPDWLPRGTYGSLTLYGDYTLDYAAIYRTQPAVRTVVGFLARNIAQLGLHVFRRVGETDRVRLRDHPLALLLNRPNPFWTQFRLFNGLVNDLGVFDDAFWLKFRNADGQLVATLPIPPQYVWTKGGLVPTSYILELPGKRLELAPNDLMHYRGYNPSSMIRGLSPLETLRRVLAEEQAAGDHREGFWRNAARVGGIVERPADAPEWSDVARARFRAEFEALYSGKVGSGKTAVLEEGMSWKPSGMTMIDAQYLESRKFNVEEVARAYFVPPPMVGLLDRATFSNIDTQHRMLYQDTLGPWCTQIEQEIALQLLPEFDDQDGVYVEFNIQEKLQGSFQEQAQALQMLVGRPIMSADEGRAKMNLPAKGGEADELVVPLNVLIGGQASPRDSAPPKALGHGDISRQMKAAAGEVDPTLADLRTTHRAKWGEVLRGFFGRQRAAVETKLGAAKRRNGGAKDAVSMLDLWDAARWDRELLADLLALGTATSTVWGEHVASEFGAELDASLLAAWLGEHSRIGAQSINQTTHDAIVAALRGDTPGESIAALFDAAVGSRADQIAWTQVTATANFGAHSGAEQAGARTKRWQVNSSRPRPAHAALNGVAVPLAEHFPSSPPMKWPGDPSGGADQLANCSCSVVFVGGEG